MKKHYLLFFSFLVLSFCAKAQWVSIPDTNFGTWLNTNGFDSCLQGNNNVGWQMDTTCNTVLYRTDVDCSNIPRLKDLTGIEYFHSLQVLNCSYDSISQLVLPASTLTYLDCSSNQLTSLPPLPNTLHTLACSSNPLINYPSLPSSLWFLFSEGVNAPLPNLPNSLIELYCGFSSLTSLPALPSSLRILSCRRNQLTALPTLPSRLRKMYCSENQLTTLPLLPDSIEVIECGYNELISLPALPNSLVELKCNSNNLTSLPMLPGLLRKLNCGLNSLHSLPTLPDSVDLLCGFNQLTSLPDLPEFVTRIVCNNNPNLTCLPNLTHIGSFIFYYTGVVCLPNYGNVDYSNPALSTLPLCDSTNNINGCPIFNSISQISNPQFEIHIYPNPATNQLNINLDGVQAERVRIYNTDGKLVADIKQPAYNNIDISSLAKGVYVAELTVRDTMQRVRWVKM